MSKMVFSCFGEAEIVRFSILCEQIHPTVSKWFEYSCKAQIFHLFVGKELDVTEATTIMWYVAKDTFIGHSEVVRSAIFSAFSAGSQKDTTNQCDSI